MNTNRHLQPLRHCPKGPNPFIGARKHVAGGFAPGTRIRPKKDPATSKWLRAWDDVEFIGIP